MNVDKYNYYRNKQGEIQYNKKCLNCIHDCKQSFKADLMTCNYKKKKEVASGNKG